MVLAREKGNRKKENVADTGADQSVHGERARMFEEKSPITEGGADWLVDNEGTHEIEVLLRSLYCRYRARRFHCTNPDSPVNHAMLP